jgi:hypothetical protein
MECPSLDIDEIRNDPVVRAAADQAWANSNEGLIVEDGFSVFQCRDLSPTGWEYYTQIEAGSENQPLSVLLPVPVGTLSDGCRFVAAYHTHPFPDGTLADINEAGLDVVAVGDSIPSDDDLKLVADYGVPGMILHPVGEVLGASSYLENSFGPREAKNPAWRCLEVVEVTFSLPVVSVGLGGSQPPAGPTLQYDGVGIPKGLVSGSDAINAMNLGLPKTIFSSQVVSFTNHYFQAPLGRGCPSNLDFILLAAEVRELPVGRSFDRSTISQTITPTSSCVDPGIPESRLIPITETVNQFAYLEVIRDEGGNILRFEPL